MLKDDRASCIHLTCSSCLIKVLHLPLALPNSLSSRNVTKTRTDGHRPTSPLQIIMHLLIRLERFEDFLRIMDYNIFGGESKGPGMGPQTPPSCSKLPFMNVRVHTSNYQMALKSENSKF